MFCELRECAALHMATDISEENTVCRNLISICVSTQKSLGVKTHNITM
jgi:hypothetical protein